MKIYCGRMFCGHSTVDEAKTCWKKRCAESRQSILSGETPWPFKDLPIEAQERILTPSYDHIDRQVPA